MAHLQLKAPLKIAIIAGEASGDLLAANLIEELQLQLQTHGQMVEFIGIGGAKMAAVGFKSSYCMQTLAVAGFGLDILIKLPKIYLLYWRITRQIIAFQPDIFIGVDAPEFNFAVEAKLKKQASIKIVHYVSPSIWAWRYKRIFKIKKIVDCMLCLLPFEVTLYQQQNIAAQFVGHPLARQIEQNIDIAFYRKQLSLNPHPNGKIFTVLIGSRYNEFARLATPLIEACTIIAQQIPNALFLFPLLSSFMVKRLEQKLAKVKFNYKILYQCTKDAIKASDLVISKSGTVSLEVALCAKPFILVYKTSPLTAWLVRRLARSQIVGLANIILNETIVPELLQENATPTNIANHFIALYHDSAKQQYMINKFKLLHQQLTAASSAVSAILQLIPNFNEIK